NETLLDGPEMVNEDPYGEGWLIVVHVKDAAELETLMDAQSYESYLEEIE
ncbi:MAG: glycine cleavage system protein H, partial [Deltaproteobacteria bacterium]|nr:glycine cleavage system protein H [Deltaproteobacteria bacterium]